MADNPPGISDLILPDEALVGTDDQQGPGISQFTKDRDGFMRNLFEGATLRGDRTANSPMSETFPEILAESATEAALMMTGAKRLSTAVKTTKGFGGKLMGFIDELALTIDKGPKAFFAGSTILPTAGGTIGREISTNIAPDSELAAFFGEFTGSVGFDIAVPLAKKTIVSGLDLIPADSAVNTYLLNPAKIARDAASGFMERRRSGVDPFNVTPRTRRTFEEAGVTKERVLEGDIARGREEEVLPGAVQFMSPSLRADSFDLMQIEKSVIDNAKDTKLSNETIRNLENINRVVADGFQFGDVGSYSSFMSSRSQYYDGLIESQIEVAAREAKDATDNMGKLIDPEGNVNAARTQERANQIVFARIDANLKSARTTEGDKWDNFASLSKTEMFDTSNFAATYNKIVKGANQVERTNIPKVDWLEVDQKELAKLTEGMSKADIDAFTEIPYKIGESVNASEIRSMVSQLRGIHRSALTGDNINYQTAHWAKELGDALNKDLLEVVEDVAPELSEAINDATSFSAAYNKIFRSDTIQDMYLQNSAGQRRVKPGEALTSAQLFRVEGARESLDDILMATSVDPETLLEGGQDPAVIKALEDYLSFSLVDDGAFNVESARKMLVDNELLLDRLPAFRDKLRNVVELNDTSALKISEINGAFEPAKAMATTFLKTNVDNITTNIINSGDKAPAELAKVLRELKQDDTGEALMGLKQSFADYVFNQSQSEVRLIADGPMTRFISGPKLEDILNQDHMPGLMTMLFEPEELRRWSQIRATARRVSRRQVVPGTAGPIDKNLASQFISNAASFGGAIVGGELGSASPGGSIQAANKFSTFFENTFRNWINDPTAVFMRDAIFDQNKLEALLTAPGSEAAAAAKSTWETFLREQLTKVGQRPYTYNPLIHGINPADEKDENEM